MKVWIRLMIGFQKLISQLEVHAAPVSREDINQKFLSADEVVCSFFAQQTTSPPLDNEDLQQIDQDDLEELDIRWQVAMLTVRVQRFIKKTGRNLDFKGKQPVTLIKSQARDSTTNEPSSQALVAQDSLGGYDWSNDFDELINYALMSISSSSSSSSSDNEVRSSDEEITPTNNRFSKADGYHVVPPPITGNFLTPRADISVCNGWQSRYLFTGSCSGEVICSSHMTSNRRAYHSDNELIYKGGLWWLLNLIPTLIIHKDHPKGQILGDLKSAVQTRGKIQKASSVQQALEEGIDYEEVFVPVAKIEANRLYAQKILDELHRSLNYVPIKTATTPIVANKPLVKDKDGIDVDVHVYWSMIGSLMYLTASRPDIMFVVCACARFQVTPKASHLNAVKRIFRLRAIYDAELVSAASLVHTIKPTLSAVRSARKFMEVLPGKKIVSLFVITIGTLASSQTTIDGEAALMLLVKIARQYLEGEGSGEPTEPQPTPSPTQPSTGDQPPETSSSHATITPKKPSPIKVSEDARPDIDAARQEDSDVKPRTPPTTTSIFDDEDITMAQTLI
ncbi:hypothetical protein Tco_1367759 [Tanacetum coccineum]